MEFSPASVMFMWAAGVAGGSAIVARWAIVGSGFAWLGGGVILLLGAPAAAFTGSPLGWAGCIAGLGLFIGKRVRVAAGLAAAVCLLGAATAGAHPVATVSGAFVLGGVTIEMMLGHWYLVDPRLPRWALRRLAVGGGSAALVDFAVLASLGVFPWSAGDLAVGLGFIVLALTTGVLMAAVFAALKEEGYSGVMAATGLSYLALLTAFGATVIGRLLVAGPVLA